MFSFSLAQTITDLKHTYPLVLQYFLKKVRSARWLLQLQVLDTPQHLPEERSIHKTGSQFKVQGTA